MNTLCSNVKNISSIPFPIELVPYSCASRSDAHNLVKSFEGKIKFLDYEIIRPKYDLVNFVRDHLKLGYGYRHVPLEKKVPLTPTCRVGLLPNIRKTREKEDDKDKGKEQ